MSGRGYLTVRLAAALGVGALLGALVGACGGASSASGPRAGAVAAAFGVSTTSSAIPPGQPVRGDGDADNPSDIDGNGDSDSAAVGGADADNDTPTRASYDFPDADDRATFAYGRAPSAREQREIVGVVKSYYAAGSLGDGRAACALLLPSFAGMVAELYGRGGTPYLRGASSCAAVLSKLFTHYREQLSEAVTVVRVRAKGGRAQAILSSRRMPASSIALARSAGAWRVEELFGQPLP